MERYKKKNVLYFTNESIDEKEIGVVLEVHEDDEMLLIISSKNEFFEVPYSNVFGRESIDIFMDIWDEEGYTKKELKDILLSYS